MKTLEPCVTWVQQSDLARLLFDLKLTNKSNRVLKTQLKYLPSRNSNCSKITRLLGRKRTIICLLEYKRRNSSRVRVCLRSTKEAQSSFCSLNVALSNKQLFTSV